MVKAREEVLKDPILRKIVNVIVKELDPDKIILFGSRARGDYDDESDYDILVLKEGIKPEERRKLEGKIYLRLRMLGRPVDVIVQDTRRFHELKTLWYLIYYDAHREGVVVYDKRKSVVGVRA